MLLAFGGIICALIVIILWASAVLTFNTLALLSLCSFLMGIVFIEGKLKTALICYASASCLSLILPVDKTNALAFIFFFGYYPILKSYIERINNLTLEIVVKILFFLVISFAGVYGYFWLFSAKLSEVLPLGAVAISATVFFAVLDYVLSLLFDYYYKRIRTKIRRG